VFSWRFNIRVSAVPNLFIPRADSNLFHSLPVKVKRKSPTTRHGGAWGKRSYSSYSFLITALDGGEWSASRSGRALPPGKGPTVLIVQEAGWA
jgi:hypothetical protein